MLIGAGLDARLGLSFGEVRDVAAEAKRLGFESLWTPAGGVPDAFHTCAAWSQDTGLRTGISVVPAARMWTPLALAAEAGTLAQLSGGSFVLGMGTGGYGSQFWQSVGLPERPIAVMRQYVRTVRSLLAGEAATSEGLTLGPRSMWLGAGGLPPVPLYTAALGPQMLGLAGEVADGALLNWATPERIAESRSLVDAGSVRAGRNAGDVPLTMYIRVCVDDDVAAARRAFAEQAIGYAMGRPGIPVTAGYRGMFGQMGFGDVLSELEERSAAGASMDDLAAAAPDDFLRAVGYFGPAAGAASEYARLSAGLDESIVRIVTARPGPEPVFQTLAALTPAAIRAVAGCSG
jgi:alkanesulfonate monooxygenase SsuD/methylene tetrahydromethanopterin reductase-like flavin-dependent oxidoreductase (luciferase family)